MREFTRTVQAAYVQFKQWCAVRWVLVLIPEGGQEQHFSFMFATHLLFHPRWCSQRCKSLQISSFAASVSGTRRWRAAALRCKLMCTECTGTRLTCCHVCLPPQVLWHWRVICHAAAVILSVYDRCQIKFTGFMKASSQLLNGPLLSAAPWCSPGLGAVSSLITLSNKPKEVEGRWRIILIYSHLMATWQTVRYFFLFFWLIVSLCTHTVNRIQTGHLSSNVSLAH